MYLPGDTVLITDIGAEPTNPRSFLVCNTTNVNTKCCRGMDGGNVGEWFFPNGSMVPRNRGSPNGNFTRTGWTHQVRLNRRNNAMTPLGTYTCVVPDMNNVMNHTATVTLGKVIATLFCSHVAICSIWQLDEITMNYTIAKCMCIPMVLQHQLNNMGLAKAHHNYRFHSLIRRYR